MFAVLLRLFGAMVALLAAVFLAVWVWLLTSGRLDPAGAPGPGDRLPRLGGGRGAEG
jgi:hypothetical protein